MVVRTFGAAIEGIDGALIVLEAVLQKEIPKIHITGLPGDVVRESTHRVSACLAGLGFDVPTARILIHLSPASARKRGSHFDLPIAAAILAVEGHLPREKIKSVAMLGELLLNGHIHRVEGAIGMLEALHQSSEIQTILVPVENSEEAALVASSKIRLVSQISEVIEFLRGNRTLDPLCVKEAPDDASLKCASVDQVAGQPLAKRALQIALAGRHHLLMLGPPGVGKSLLAGSAPSLLPSLKRTQRVEVLKNYVQAGGRVVAAPPFRSPHHSISSAAFLGGGSGVVIPGEVTLAHRGILFLDEFPEFKKDALEGLRLPLETGEIHLHRIGHPLSLPARFTLIAAMNPCPCGYSLGGPRPCRCAPERLSRYRHRVSGPIFDRLDLLTVMHFPREAAGQERSWSAEKMRKGLASAWLMQEERYRDLPEVERNGDCPVGEFEKRFRVAAEASKYIQVMKESGEESFRVIHRAIRMARTVADLEGSESLELQHLQEVSAFRCRELSKQLFGL